MKTFDGYICQRLLIKIWNQRKRQLEIWYKLKLMIIRWSLMSVPAQFVNDGPLIK